MMMLRDEMLEEERGSGLGWIGGEWAAGLGGESKWRLGGG